MATSPTDAIEAHEAFRWPDRKIPGATTKAHAMRRERHTPPTTTSVRGLAVRRGYLLAIDKQSARLFKLFNLIGRAAPMPSKDGAHQYGWKLRDADAWLRKQPLLSDQ